MAWPQNHRMESRQRILDSATRLFARHGFASVTIEAVMADASLTRGAFYSHFRSKADLHAQALRYGAARGERQLQSMDRSRLGDFIRSYLDQGRGNSFVCPLAYMINDIRHQDDSELRATYNQLFQGLVDRIAEVLQEAPARQDCALQLATTLVGGLALARTLGEAARREAALQACEATCLLLLGLKD